MSPRGGKRHPDEDEPMLVLGENRPDVEDTTPEELARQRAEVERMRLEMEQQVQERKRLAEAELEEERLGAEKEIARRQREIDEAQERIRRAERTKRAKRGTPRKKGSGTNRLLAAAEVRSGMRVPRMRTVVPLALAASALLAVGGAGSLDRPSEEEIATFEKMDQSREQWLRAGAALDDEVTRYLAGEQLTTADGTLPSVALARVAHGIDPEPYPLDYYLEVFEDDAAPLLTAPGTSTSRVLGAWKEARSRSGYAVSVHEVRRSRDLLDPDPVWPVVLIAGGALGLGGLAFVLLRGGTRVGAGVAALALVPAALVLLADDDPDLEAASASHGEMSDWVNAVAARTQKDLEVVLRLRTPETYEAEDYWDAFPTLTMPDVPAGVAAQPYADARAELADVDITSLDTSRSAELAHDLVGPGTALLEQGLEDVTARRGPVLTAVDDVDIAPSVGLTVAAAALPLGALVPALLRRREVTG